MLLLCKKKIITLFVQQSSLCNFTVKYLTATAVFPLGTLKLVF